MPTVHAAVSDMIFSSRISAEARALNLQVNWVRSPAACSNWQESPPQLLIVDLNLTSTDPLELITLAKALPAPPRIVAFLSHVQRDLALQATDHGADTILPRSAFVTQLPELLRGFQ